MLQHSKFLRKYILGCGLTLALIVPLTSAGAQTEETVLHSFGAAGDGGIPEGGLIRDKKGNLYGTTVYGGGVGYGAVFKVASDGTETVLYSFTGANGDGSYPRAGLAADQAGNIYGTTYAGGVNDCGFSEGCGTVFKIAPDNAETVLYRFKGGDEGFWPMDRLIVDHQGNLYGTTLYGGDPICGDGCGTIFRIAPDGTETVLYSFCGVYCDDGFQPWAGLIEDKTGNLYGTALGGGYFGGGAIFKLAPDGSESTLYAFCTQEECPDGRKPIGGLVMDSMGNLYGTTEYGGARGDGGVIYKLTPDGTETVLHSFDSKQRGAMPVADLVLDGAGNLYGTTSGGGQHGCKHLGCGTVFELTHQGKEKTLYSFCAEKPCIDGAEPWSDLLIDKAGNLFGTTMVGGDGCDGERGCGVVFEIKR